MATDKQYHVKCDDFIKKKKKKELNKFIQKKRGENASE